MDDDVKKDPMTVVSEFGVFISNCFRTSDAAALAKPLFFARNLPFWSSRVGNTIYQGPLEQSSV